MQFLTCSPDYFEIAYEINPWMHKEKSVQPTRAAEQHRQLLNCLRQAGAEIEEIAAQPGLPDMVYTANAGLVRQGKVVLSQFANVERQGEEKFFQHWFESQGYEVLNPSEKNGQRVNFEGAGDALLAGNTLFHGTGFRSDADLPGLQEFLNIQTMVKCQLIIPEFYHLDTCFCPLNERKAMLYPAAIDKKSLKQIEKNIEIIEIDAEDARLFACNAIALNQTVILPARSQNTEKKLATHGFNPVAVELDEFLKGGGAAKCLTLRLDQP